MSRRPAHRSPATGHRAPPAARTRSSPGRGEPLTRRDRLPTRDGDASQDGTVRVIKEGGLAWTLVGGATSEVPRWGSRAGGRVGPGRRAAGAVAFGVGEEGVGVVLSRHGEGVAGLLGYSRTSLRRSRRRPIPVPCARLLNCARAVIELRGAESTSLSSVFELPTMRRSLWHIRKCSWVVGAGRRAVAVGPGGEDRGAWAPLWANSVLRV